MRRAAWVLRAAAVVAGTVTVVASGPPARADGVNQFGPYLIYTDGSLVRTWIEIGFHIRIPPAPRVFLVQSGVPSEQAQRVPVRLKRGSIDEENQSIDGFTTRPLVAERTYDVVVQSGRTACAVLPSAFTAHAPRVTLSVASAARGETVHAQVDFGSRTPRFRVGSVAARITGDFGGDFEIEVPRALGRDVTQATVTVVTARRRISAPQPLTILRKRQEVSAVVDGVRVSCTGHSYFTSPTVLGSYRGGPPSPQVYVSGSRSRRFPAASAAESLQVRLPVELTSANLPITLTGADGVQVTWANQAAEDGDGVIRGWAPGPRGWFLGRLDVTATLESIDGPRITGTFAGHMVETTYSGEVVPGGREFDITDGRFEVEPE